MVINITGFICGFIGGVTDEFNCTSRQKIFWTILLPFMPLGCLCGIVIAKFFRWLAEEDKQNLKINNESISHSCRHHCKYRNTLGKYLHSNNMSCKILESEFLKGECPCEGKLYEKG